MNGTALLRRLGLLARHPSWSMGEAAARARLLLAPRRGRIEGLVGPIRFPFDLDLHPMVREMRARAYSTHLVALLGKLLRPGDTFVDVGASIGYISAVALGRVGTSGRVLSFEPVAAYHDRLEAARRMNPAYQWEIFPVALGATDGAAEIALSRGNIGWNSLVPGHVPEDGTSGKAQVAVRRLDDCLRQAAVDRVRVMKIDVEGYEGLVIRGAERCLREGRVDHLIMEVQPWCYASLSIDLGEMLGLLEGCGYEARQSIRPYRPARPADFEAGADIWFRRVEGRQPAIHRG
jgi:FkbM family methyltransferase